MERTVSGFGSWLKTRWGLAVQASILIACLTLTVQRNEVWRSKLTLWEDAVAKSPGKIRPLINAGMEHKIAGNREKAEAYFTRAISIETRNALDVYHRGFAKTNLAMLRIEQGRYPDALTLLNEVLAESPNLDAMNAMALLALIGGNPQVAVEMTGEILDKYDAWRLRPSIWATRGQAFHHLGQCDDAQAAYVTLKALKPEFQIPVCP